MKLFKVIFRMVRLGLIWMLAAYWLIFASYTVERLVTGGPSAVVVWYRHISNAPFQWHWGVFLGGQIVILGLTVALYLIGRTPQGHENRSGKL